MNFVVRCPREGEEAFDWQVEDTIIGIVWHVRRIVFREIALGGTGLLLRAIVGWRSSERRRSFVEVLFMLVPPLGLFEIRPTVRFQV